MARTSRSLLSASRLLAVLSFVLLLLSLLPTRAISWTSSLAKPIQILLSPVQGPLRGAVVLVAGKEGATIAGETPEAAELRKKVDEYLFLWQNAQAENQRLLKQIAELQKTVALNPEVMRPVYAPVIGPGADLSAGLLAVKAGERDGVLLNSVAVVDGVQLIGRVTRVEGRYSLVLPITQRASRGLKGVIMIGDQRGPFCDLVPMGGGTLNGRVFFEEGGVQPQLKAGMLVRLDDPEWPTSSRMLVIGEIIEVSSLPQQPNRRVVTVKPGFAIDALSQVVIRVPTDGSGGAP